MGREEFADECNKWLADKPDLDGPITSNTIAKIEQGRTTWPRLWRRRAFRAIAGAATDADLGFRDKRRSLKHVLDDSDVHGDRAVDANMSDGTEPASHSELGVRSLPESTTATGPRLTPAPVSVSPGGDGVDDYGVGHHESVEGVDVERPAEIGARRRISRRSNTDEWTLQYIEVSVRSLIDRLERDDPLALAPSARRMRTFVEGLIRGSQHPKQRLRLYTSAAHLSGVLATLALDLGAHASARAYAQESFDIAADAQLGDIEAWSRAVQSLVAYYGGQYRDAVELARDGQLRAETSVHKVRLAVNGEARALARLGDARAAEEAVDRAFDLVASLPFGSRVSASLDLGAYCAARVAANAATAYLAIGRTDEVDSHLDTAVAAFDAAGMHGPRALSRLDQAMAEATRDQPDLERAASFAMQALELNAEYPLESVDQRAAEFVSLARRWNNVPAIRAVAEVVGDRRTVQRALTAQVALA